MQHAPSARRSFLLALTLLASCAASQPSHPETAGYLGHGATGDFLAGRYALAEGDDALAATALLKAAAANPGNAGVTLEAMIACLEAGRPEAVTLARQLPDNQVAGLILAGADIRAGHWRAAEDRFHALQRQGIVQFLQPLLVAWSQAGDGRTDAALSTLGPYVDNPRLRGIFSLHAAMIADLGNRTAEAARLYKLAQGELGDPNLRLVQVLASWQARTGQPAEAQHSLASLLSTAPDLSIAMPSLLAKVTNRPVGRPSDGIAEAYFTFAAMLRAQDQAAFAHIMLRLALDLRPDLAAARLLVADILVTQNHPQQALQALASVPPGDPIISVVRLRQAALIQRAGQSDRAMRDLEGLARDYPDSPLPDEQRGDMLRAQARFPEAVAAYDKAIARIGQPVAADWVAFYDRGVAEEQSHQWPKAVGDFQQALSLAPGQPFVLNYLGYSWADQGQHLAEARRMIDQAAQARPNDGAITDSLGWAMFRQGDLKGAVKTLERAAELEPADSTINGHLGDAYSAVGRKLEADFQWRRALTLNPTPGDAAKLEVKLNGGHPGAVVSNP